jgi:hypothetical protein
MIRVALFGVVIVILVGSIVFVAGRLINQINPAEPANEAITSRFPEEWGSAPVVEYKKPLAWPSAVSQMSTAEFVAAVTAVERPRPQPRPPQPADAVLNDAQITSIRDRLELSEEQKPSWQAVEASLREVVWDRRHGVRSKARAAQPRAIEAGRSAFRAHAQRKAVVQDRGARPYRRTAARPPGSLSWRGPQFG